MNNPVQPILVAPTLFDKAFDEIGLALTTEFSWLTNSYRKAERMPRTNEKGRTNYEPHVFVGRQNYTKEYLNVLPDAHLQNHCFFTVEDGETITERKGQLGDIYASFSIVFWWDFRTVYPTDHLTKTTENIKREIGVLLAKTALKTCTITQEKFWTEARNIYKGFDIEDAKNQFLMRPYGGLRIEGQIKIKHNC